MADFQEVYLSSPLSDLTRQARRNLLLFSLLLFLILKGDLVPSEIEPLGIVIAPERQYILPNFLSLVVAYYLLKFFIYMQMDGRLLVYKANRAEFPEAREILDWREYKRFIQANSKAIINKHGWGFLGWVLIRAVLDVFFPLAVGVFALWFYYMSGHA